MSWTERFFNLPYDLVQNALLCGEISAFGVILDRGSISRPFTPRKGDESRSLATDNATISRRVSCAAEFAVSIR